MFRPVETSKGKLRKNQFWAFIFFVEEQSVTERIIAKLYSVLRIIVHEKYNIFKQQ
jgi:hypothetical protein